MPCAFGYCSKLANNLFVLLTFVLHAPNNPANLRERAFRVGCDADAPLFSADFQLE